MGIQVNNLSKRFHQSIILDNVSLAVETGELVALLGPSGSGKTTLLRIIAGLEFADSGTILLEGEETQTKSAKDRNIGFVFQHYALFKHMTVYENVAFGLKVKPKKIRPSETEINEKVLKLLKLMHLEAYAKHYPYQLSGGQQQRIALIRALAVDPKVLLLDEPFGALDAKVRKELCRWIRMLHDELKVSSIFVTHDQVEAMEVADRIAIMNKGKIVQIGSPEELWLHPANNFVYDFLGDYNIFDAWEDEQSNVHLIELTEETRAMVEGKGGKLIKIHARPYETTISLQPEADQEFITAKVMHINLTGPIAKIELKTSTGKTIQVEMPTSSFAKLQIQKGTSVYVWPISQP